MSETMLGWPGQLMRGTIERRTFSASNGGRNIKIAATASAGTTVHQVPAGSVDEVWLYAYNSDTAARLLTVQWGGTTTVDDDIKITIPSQVGLVLVVPGLVLTGGTLACYAATTNVITVAGFINRITPA